MKTNVLQYITVLTLAAAGTASALPAQEPAAAPKKQEQAQQPAQKPAQQPAAAEGADHTGKVVETMNGGGYSYYLLEKEGTKTWVAVPEMTGPKVGDTVTFRSGIEMANFKSRALNRTFERIFFSAGPMSASGEDFLKNKAHGMGGAGKEQQAAAKDPHAGLPKEAHAAVEKEKKAAGKGEKAAGKVEKAEGKDGYTIADLYAKTDALKGKDVAVRGRVTKASKNIMGKNWLHIEDGSTAEDLVVTSKDFAEEGVVVTAKGKLSVDKDFGAGYKFHVIIDDGSLAK